MNNYNLCYRHGALWKTRTRIRVYTSPDYNKKKTIPRGEIVLLMYYSMNLNFQEEVVFLWNNKVCYADDLDLGVNFLLDPFGINTSMESRQ